MTVKRRSLVKDFVILAAGTVLNMLVGLLTAPVITRLVDTESYGEFSLFTTYGGIALMALGLGMDQALVRFFHEEDSLGYRKKLISSCWTLPVVLLAVLGCIAIVGICVSPEQSWGLPSLSLIILFIAYTLVLIIQRLAFLVVRMQFKTVLLSLLNVSQKLLYAGLAVVLILTTALTDEYSLMLATIASVGGTALIAIMSDRKLWWRGGADKALPYPYAELIRYGIPLAFASGVSMVFQATDRIVMQMYCSISDIGIYASAMNLASVFAVVQTSFNQLWAPSVVEHYSKNKDDRTFYERGYKFIVLAMFAFGATLIFGKEVLALMLGGSYREAAYLLPFLAFHPMMYTISEASSVGISLMKQSKYQVYVSCISCILNIVGCLVLVPRFGMYGAAISTGVSYIAYFAFRTYFSQRLFPFEIGLSKIIIATTVMVLFAAYNTVFTSASALSVALYFAVLVTIALLYKDTLKEGIAMAITKLRGKHGKARG